MRCATGVYYSKDGITAAGKTHHIEYHKAIFRLPSLTFRSAPHKDPVATAAHADRSENKGVLH